MPTHGEELIQRCKQHVIETMQTLPECAPDGPDPCSGHLWSQAFAVFVAAVCPPQDFSLALTNPYRF